MLHLILCASEKAVHKSVPFSLVFVPRAVINREIHHTFASEHEHNAEEVLQPLALLPPTSESVIV